MQRQDNLEHARLVNAVVGLGGSMEPVEVMPAIARSWNRCAHEFGLDPSRDEPVVILESRELKARQEPLSRLRAIAQGEMATLYQQLSGSGFSVLLTDSDGVVLDYLGDPAFTDTAAQCGMVEGAWWNERFQGTNGMGTCAVEQRPLLVHHNEHYLNRNVGLTCSAAPIFDHEGQLMAVLDASSHSHMAQQHTLVLVNMSAQMIENRAFLCRFREQYALRFHSRPEFIGTLWEGALALDEEGRVLAANRSALFQLGHKKAGDLNGRRLEELFNTNLAALLGRKTQGWLNPVPLYEARHGNRFFGLIRPPENGQVVLAPPARKPLPVSPATGAPRTVGLEDLQFGDPVMDYNVRCAKRVMARDIPILLTGETGTGKELFAQAIHAEQSGPARPFVAVNCASIPESLIESELFGYKAGAFTGASREGRRGKILQANGGTLFLDEIGDMPVMLQARLLRVLEEREVIPLGGETPVRVDIKLVSATHRNLKELVAEGRFREDLYYRLQGITLTLPPLRERQDRRALIRHLLAQERGENEEATLADAALDLLDRFPWPGNIRQLRNVLRTALALRDGPAIEAGDLPEDIRRQNPGVTHAEHREPTPADPGEVAALTALEQAEREAILNILEKSRWNVTVAARQLSVSRNTLYRKMKHLNIRLEGGHDLASPPRIAWGLTGSGHYLRESLELLDGLADVDVFVTKAATEVLSMYGIPLKTLREKHRVYQDHTASSVPVGFLYSGHYHTLVIGPATSNTVAKCVAGISDTLVTNLYAQAGKCRIPSIVFACDTEAVMVTEAPGGSVWVHPRPIDLDNTARLKTFPYTTVTESIAELKSAIEARLACLSTSSS